MYVEKQTWKPVNNLVNLGSGSSTGDPNDDVTDWLRAAACSQSGNETNPKAMCLFQIVVAMVFLRDTPSLWPGDKQANNCGESRLMG